MDKTYVISKGQKPTKEQLREIAEAKKHPIVFDEDCPELSPAMYSVQKLLEPEKQEEKSLSGKSYTNNHRLVRALHQIARDYTCLQM